MIATCICFVWGILSLGSVDGDKTDHLHFTAEHWRLIVKCCVDKFLDAKQQK